MKKFIPFTLLIISYLSTYAQASFEKGFFINNNDEKTVCFIKNLDLLYNPRGFTYKLSETSKENTATISDVKVFEIYDIVRYERHQVKIDRSSELFDEISINKKAEFNNEQLYLKVLISGKASLYEYSESNFLRFFFKNKNTNIEQLVYKSYNDEFSSSSIKKNERYKQQLLNSFDCKIFTKVKFTSLQYRKSKLSKLFIDYNNCINSSYKNYTTKKTNSSKSAFNLNIRPGLNFTSTFLKNALIERRSIDFKNKITARIGVELEFVLGFNNNKWAFIIEPTYNTMLSSDAEDTIGRKTTINYSSLEVPFGIRHYLFFNKKSKLFLNALVVADFPINSSVTGENEIDVSSSTNYAFGIGYKYNKKFSVELRQFTTRNTTSGFAFFGALYNHRSIIIGYTLF